MNTIKISDNLVRISSYEDYLNYLEVKNLKLFIHEVEDYLEKDHDCHNGPEDSCRFCSYWYNRLFNAKRNLKEQEDEE